MVPFHRSDRLELGRREGSKQWFLSEQALPARHEHRCGLVLPAGFHISETDERQLNSSAKSNSFQSNEVDFKKEPKLHDPISDVRAMRRFRLHSGRIDGPV
jgi:hypothetical protein